MYDHASFYGSLSVGGNQFTTDPEVFALAEAVIWALRQLVWVGEGKEYNVGHGYH